MLQVQNLSVSFESDVGSVGGSGGEIVTEVICDLSFSVEKKETLIILGPNGAGKTTLLRALLGLVPYTGKVHWETKNISYLPPQEFIKRNDLPPLKIEDFFKFKTDNIDSIREVFYEVGLETNLLNRQFSTLSTGQFQRMLIAWALVNKPEVLILDEPTSGIDIGGEETIYTLLHKFWEQQDLTIIMVTHDLNIVWEHANKVLCLNKKKMCLGAPNEVLTPEQLKELYGTGLKYYDHHHNK